MIALGNREIRGASDDDNISACRSANENPAMKAGFRKTRNRCGDYAWPLPVKSATMWSMERSP